MRHPLDWLQFAFGLLAAALIGAILLSAVIRSYEHGKQRNAVTDTKTRRSYR